MDRETRAVHVGLGPMGLRVVQHILGARQGIRYVGAVDPAPGLEGRDLGELAGFAPVGVRVGGDASRLFAETRPDIAIYDGLSLAHVPAAVRGGGVSRSERRVDMRGAGVPCVRGCRHDGEIRRTLQAARCDHAGHRHQSRLPHGPPAGALVRCLY